jgi:hypothetical protein
MFHIADILQDGAGNAKISHNEMRTYTISLASSDSAGRNTCPRAMRRSLIQRMRDAGRTEQYINAYAHKRGLSMCSDVCVLHYSGRGQMPNVLDARTNLTNWFYEDRKTFRKHLFRRLDRIYKDYGDNVAIRPNVDSDIAWEALFPQMFDYPFHWYDYTKVSTRLGNVPANYHLTYSVNDGTLPEDWERVYAANANIAVVFDSLWLPSRHRYGYLPAVYTDPNGRTWSVADGDASDLTFLSPPGTCRGLRFKGGHASKDTAQVSEFVVPGCGGWDTVPPSDAKTGHYIAA